jgi:hypothetical protein
MTAGGLSQERDELLGAAAAETRVLKKRLDKAQG